MRASRWPIVVAVGGGRAASGPRFTALGGGMTTAIGRSECLLMATEKQLVPAADPLRRALALLMRPFGRVTPDESLGAALLTLTVFLLLTAYYLLKTAREPLILLHGGAEVKQYAAAGQAGLLAIVVNAYSALAQRVGRQWLIATVYLFFASNLVVFAILARENVVIGVPFFLWVGVFNMTAVSQFWSLAADVYTPEQGKRLFAILGIGSSVGAVAGARVAKSLAVLGPAWLMGVAAAILLVCVAIFTWVGARAGAP